MPTYKLPMGALCLNQVSQNVVVKICMLLAFHTSSSSYGLNCCEHFTFIGLQLKCIFTCFYNFYIYYYISNEYFSLEMATASLYFVEGLD